eukprot:TRINITY_DN14123_c0_g1_i1.p1 TRINITY_DN14123_c0_g1~~TRINITY_DN14123_c0_g1_i1.p1  ORF type:complete len:385 (+),score=30.98 TRINITY_DN14123_c0_g1_i1:95-1156(+)
MVSRQALIVEYAFFRLYLAEGDCYTALLLLLPILEHALRKLYLYLYNTPLARGIKLNSIFKYTPENKMYHFLPSPLIHAFHDMFVWNEAGGGIRHAIAHGVTGKGLIPVEFCDRAFAATIAYCMLWLPTAEPPAEPKQNTVANIWRYMTTEFKPAFHPRTLAHFEWNKARTLLATVAQKLDSIQDTTTCPVQPITTPDIRSPVNHSLYRILDARGLRRLTALKKLLWAINSVLRELLDRPELASSALTETIQLVLKATAVAMDADANFDTAPCVSLAWAFDKILRSLQLDSKQPGKSTSDQPSVPMEITQQLCALVRTPAGKPLPHIKGINPKEVKQHAGALHTFLGCHKVCA